jgi:hypothetical protein
MQGGRQETYTGSAPAPGNTAQPAGGLRELVLPAIVYAVRLGNVSQIHHIGQISAKDDAGTGGAGYDAIHGRTGGRPKAAARTR